MICSAADRIPSGVRSALIHTRCWSGAGIRASSSRTGISRMLPEMRRTTAASSSSRTQGLAADDAETTTMTASTVSSPSSNNFLTRLSPGQISQMSSHGATPISASSRASGSTKPDLSSLACERKARTAEAPLSTGTKDALPAAPPR